MSFERATRLRVQAMGEEIRALLAHPTWTVDPILKGLLAGLAIPGKWIFKVKKDVNAFIDGGKAGLVIKGCRQEAVDFHQVFAPVGMLTLASKPTSGRTLLAVAAVEDMEMHHDASQLAKLQLHECSMR